MQRTAGVALAERTTLRLGGPASELVETTNSDELVEAVAAADSCSDPVLVMGSGSNLVVADEGFAGTVIVVGSRGIQARPEPDGAVRVQVSGGEDWDALVACAVSSGWAGVEALSGIPGRVAAAPIQNIGAYGQEVAETIVAVRAWDRHRGEQVCIPASGCGFGYRTSRFKSRPGRFVILDVTFRFRPAAQAPVKYADLAASLGVDVGGTAELPAIREAVLGLRRSKGMVLDEDDHDTWSAGSFFTNPILPFSQAALLPPAAPRWKQPAGSVKTSAAWLIEQTGFRRGYGVGRVGLSTKHPLALTNRGGASTRELLALAREVRDGVDGRFGVCLCNEPVLIGCSL